ncbi:MAG: hypothetical protein HY526_13400 [Betaproteobacteria bacterium]|nr:hypothetical protein [Betaproteobacteria bacterium]
MRCVLPLLGLVLAIGDACGAEPLGRLFFTPAQRAQLDAARGDKLRAPLAAEPEEAPRAPEVVTYGGLVRRSDGKTTVWINDRPTDDGTGATGSPVRSRVRPDGSINLLVPQANRSVDLKVGQSVEIVSGRIAEPYAREPAPQPASRAASPERAAQGRADGTLPGPSGPRRDGDEHEQDRR